jgi:hypothetical protein
VSCPATLDAAGCIGQFARWYILQFAQGVSEFTWYSWDQLSPATSAYGVLDRWLVGASFTAPCSADATGVWTCGLLGSTAEPQLLVWNPSGNSSYDAPVPFTSYQDLSGGSNGIPANRTLTIGVEPIVLEAK